jgi:CheY-like chemotaxis protein
LAIIFVAFWSSRGVGSAIWKHCRLWRVVCFAEGVNCRRKASDPLRILIIEDDPVAAKVYGHHLKKAGYEVLIATDGPTGLQKTLQLRPDGVLLDIMLPGMSGTEVLKEIRAKKPNLAVVVYTNGFVPLLVEEMLAAGATNVFNKSSLTGKEVAHAFEKALRRKEAA